MSKIICLVAVMPRERMLRLASRFEAWIGMWIALQQKNSDIIATKFLTLTLKTRALQKPLSRSRFMGHDSFTACLIYSEDIAKDMSTRAQTSPGPPHREVAEHVPAAESSKHVLLPTFYTTNRRQSAVSEVFNFLRISV